MVQVIEIAFSCYPVTDIARARGFYEGILGLTPATISESDKGHWVEYEIGPHVLSIGSAPGWNPRSDGCTVALEVADFEAAIAFLKSRGVPFRMEPFPTAVCHMAMIADPDGNTVCIHHRRAVGTGANRFA